MDWPHRLVAILVCFSLLVGFAIVSWATTREEIIESAKAFGDCLASYEECGLFGPVIKNALLSCKHKLREVKIQYG